MADFESKKMTDQEFVTALMDPEKGVRRLREISVFSELSDEELLDLYGLGSILTVKTGTHVVIEGDPTRGLYVLLSGTVSVFKTDRTSGSMHRLAYLEEGSAFGEMSLFDDAPRSATVGAETKCYLFYLSADNFNDYLDKTGDEIQKRFYRRCAEEMAERFRSQNRDYMDSQLLLWRHALRIPKKKSDEKTEATPQANSSEPI